MTPHDALALRTFGRTRTEALEARECIRCLKPIDSLAVEAVDWKEYRLTALCPACFDEISPEETA